MLGKAKKTVTFYVKKFGRMHAKPKNIYKCPFNALHKVSDCVSNKGHFMLIF